jgi:DNA-binding transcriptional MerR regulator
LSAIFTVADMTDKDDKTYSISELAKEFDITTRSIRFYEDQGLLTPLRQGQTRIYNKRDRVRLKLILRGKRLGFSLAETGQLFELYDADKSSVTQLTIMLKLIEQKKSELHQQMDDIKVVLMELVTVEKRCRETLQGAKTTEPKTHNYAQTGTSDD